MPNSVLLSKAVIIERAVKRAKEEYTNAGANFAQDFTRQDAAILNIQRACEAAIDMGQNFVRANKLGLAQSARDVFTLLAEHKIIQPKLANTLQNMVGFRNSAVHEYQKILLPIVETIITQHLDELLEFSSLLIKQSS